MRACFCLRHVQMPGKVSQPSGCQKHGGRDHQLCTMEMTAAGPQRVIFKRAIHMSSASAGCACTYIPTYISPP